MHLVGIYMTSITKMHGTMNIKKSEVIYQPHLCEIGTLLSKGVCMGICFR